MSATEHAQHYDSTMRKKSEPTVHIENINVTGQVDQQTAMKIAQAIRGAQTRLGRMT